VLGTTLRRRRLVGISVALLRRRRSVVLRRRRVRARRRGQPTGALEVASSARARAAARPATLALGLTAATTTRDVAARTAARSSHASAARARELTVGLALTHQRAISAGAGGIDARALCREVLTAARRAREAALRVHAHLRSVARDALRVRRGARRLHLLLFVVRTFGVLIGSWLVRVLIALLIGIAGIALLTLRRWRSVVLRRRRVLHARGESEDGEHSNCTRHGTSLIEKWSVRAVASWECVSSADSIS
jgi:hypothetical protein